MSCGLAQKLELREPEFRGTLIEIISWKLQLHWYTGGTLGKIARDVSLLMQTEVAEASEPYEERTRRIVDHAT